MTYTILRITWRHWLKTHQIKRYRKVESAGSQKTSTSCFNSTWAIFCDFFKMTHESLFAQPSKTHQNDIWCFTHICAPLRRKNLNQAFFESRQSYAFMAHFIHLESIFLLFSISTKVTHEPHPKKPSKMPFVLSSYLPEKKGLRFHIIFPNNTEVCAF